MASGVRFITVVADMAGQRLDNFLLRELKKAPKSLVYRIIRKGEVRVNKGRAKPERKLAAGDVIRVPPVKLPDDEAPAVAGDGLRKVLESSVLYEDNGLLIVNKPSGLAVHGGSGINLGLVEAMRQIRQMPGLELAHRLDRETSGCLILVKKRSVLRQIHKILREDGGVDKRYVALVSGQWSKRRGQVEAPLQKNVLKSGERVVRVDVAGKPSKTLFRPLQSFDTCSLVEAKPITGRTHQIRVHAQYAGHPLAGDPKYGDDAFNAALRSRGLRRLFLHAKSLAFSLESGNTVEVEAPLPGELAKLLKHL